jgi:hypothetical protein
MMMKRNNQFFFFFIAIIVLSAVYRVIPFESRPVWLGAPQLALALFAGSVIKNRKWAFAVPLISLLLSDILMQVTHAAGLTPHYPGFYAGQFINYGLIALLTVVGFFVRPKQISSIIGGMVTAPTLYFLLSNFAVWVSGGGYMRPKTFGGLMQCYADGIPFYGYTLLSMAVFGFVLFGTYHLLQKAIASRTAAA